MPTVRIPHWRRAGSKGKDRSELLQGRTFRVPAHTLKNVQLRVFWGKKIICRSSLFWLFVEFSKFLLGGPHSVPGGEENPYLGGQLVFSVPVFILRSPER